MKQEKTKQAPGNKQAERTGEEQLEADVFKVIEESLFDHEEWNEDCSQYTMSCTSDEGFVRLLWNVNGEHAELKAVILPDGTHKDSDALKYLSEAMAERGFVFEDDLIHEREKQIAIETAGNGNAAIAPLTPARIDEKNVTSGWIADCIDETYGHGYSWFSDNGENRLLFFCHENHQAEIIYYSYDNIIVVKAQKEAVAKAVMNDIVEYFYGGDNGEYDIRKEIVGDLECRLAFYHLPYDIQKIDFRGEVYTRWQFDESDYDCYPSAFCSKSKVGEFVPYYGDFLFHAQDGFFRCHRNNRESYTEI